jgi:hypothetical protein
MTNKYTLVNPIIIGNLDTTVEASSNAIAAKEIYNRLSKNFNKTQNNLLFTIQKVYDKGSQSGGGKNANKPSYYSFKVKEVNDANGSVVYTISRYTGKVDYNRLTKNINTVHNKIKHNKNADLLDSDSEINMAGGAKKDDDSASFEKLLE